MDRSVLPVQLAYLASQHLKLYQVDEFQVTMPKEALPPKLEALPKAPAQPSATTAVQSTPAKASEPSNQDSSNNQVGIKDAAAPDKGDVSVGPVQGAVPSRPDGNAHVQATRT